MHINEMLNKKTYIGNIEPNPKEFGIWIKEDGTHMIYDYTNNQWVCECSGSSKVLYYKVAAGVTSIIQASPAAYSAGIKIFDTSENRFEYITPAMMLDAELPTMIAPNFSFATDEYCIAYLPISINAVNLDGANLQIVASTIEDLYAMSGQEIPSGITRITEEEYWDNTIPSIFYIENKNEKQVAFRYDEGMTLGDWINSDYNSIGLYYIEKYGYWNAVDTNFGSSDKEYGGCVIWINGEDISASLTTLIQNNMIVSLMQVD